MAMRTRIHRFTALFLALILSLAANAPVAGAASKTDLDNAIDKAAAYLMQSVESPAIGSEGGEWAIIGLARSGVQVPEAYYAKYYSAVEEYVRQRQGVLHDYKYTEYSRVILSLTAAGYDPSNVAGYDLTLPLGDYDKTVWQGINGAIWALIALDSNRYAIAQNPTAQTQATRDLYVREILRRQLSDGGWVLSEDSSDPDITGMALQALAKYQGNAGVKAATDRALAFLSAFQESDGGYARSEDETSESVVQVLIALCELSISADDPRFVKNGYTLVDNILSYQNSDGSFNHASGGYGESLMSTEQALYGLAAAKRAAEGKSSLYRMSDAARQAQEPNPTAAPKASAEPSKISPPSGLPGKNADVSPMPIASQGKTFADIQASSSKEAIEALAERGIISGMTDSLFRPDANMTRAEFAVIITRGLGLPARPAYAFRDVSSGAWYFAGVGTAYYYEIASGVSEAEFKPDGTINREEAAAMIARASKLCGLDIKMSETEIRDILAQFGDYRTTSEWSRASFAFCYKSGLLSQNDLNINSKLPVKRSEIAEMLYRMLRLAKLI
ncbi:MAG: S-layer homology domain-containing protein [Clostridiales bacterium]|jgi:hypothetical protein|nr:S-layer homology domain-containing protein [Clostridiales bacterium]